MIKKIVPRISQPTEHKKISTPGHPSDFFTRINSPPRHTLDPVRPVEPEEGRRQHEDGHDPADGDAELGVATAEHAVSNAGEVQQNAPEV